MKKKKNHPEQPAEETTEKLTAREKKERRKQREQEQRELEKRLIAEGRIPVRTKYRPRSFVWNVFAVCMAFIFGIVFTIGAFIGGGYFVTSKYSLKDVLTAINVDYSQYITEEYAQKTLLELFQDVRSTEFTNLNSIAKYTPFLRTQLDAVNEQLASLGVIVDVDTLMQTNFGDIGTYFQEEVIANIQLGGVLGVFSAIDVFSFYIFHEFALIPTFIAILLWGGYARKTTALTMAIYLTLGAMVSLAGLVALYFALPETYPFSFLGIRDAVVAGEIFDGNVSVVFALLLFGFGILVSLFPFHTWAPDTYASAPTPVSMLHAGVLKKFGLYGLIQLGALALPLGLAEWQNWIIWLALGNIVLIGLIAMTQKDLKQMVAYSSVMHMGPIFLGIAAFAISGGNTAGLGGAVVLMFAHGLSVALLFHLGQAVCDRTGTYEMAKMGGLTAKAPVLAAFFVAATMASIGLPGFANFWGELTIFASLAQIQPSWLLGAIVLSIVISAIYGLRAVAKIFYGKNSGFALTEEQFEKVRDITPAERVPALILFAALVAVGFVPSLITKNIDETLKRDFAPAASVLRGAAAADEEAVPAEPCEACGENAGAPAGELAKTITVTVSGAVENPGEFTLDEASATLLKLLEQTKIDSSATFVSVLRVDGRFAFDLEELRSGAAEDISLEDGDKISIE